MIYEKNKRCTLRPRPVGRPTFFRVLCATDGFIKRILSCNLNDVHRVAVYRSQRVVRYVYTIMVSTAWRRKLSCPRHPGPYSEYTCYAYSSIRIQMAGFNFLFFFLTFNSNTTERVGNTNSACTRRNTKLYYIMTNKQQDLLGGAQVEYVPIDRAVSV